jgi:type II secretion system protein C
MFPKVFQSQSLHRVLVITACIVILWINVDTVRILKAQPDVRIQEQTESGIFSTESPGISKIFALSDEQRPDDQDAETTESWISKTYGVELKGTVAGEMAVFRALSSSDEILVHVDDSIGSGTVTSVTRNQVVIDGPKGRDTLSLPATNPAQTDQKNQAPRTGIIERKDISSVLSNINRLAEEITLNPLRGADGVLAGYRVSALKPDGLIARMGIRNRDILLSVNSRKIQTPEELYRTFEEACHENRLTLSVKRQNREVELVYQIR